MSGTVTISVEVELGWGMHDKRKYDHLSADASVERETLSFLLELCERYNIPISFDIVGHLLHESCSGNHQGPYPDNWWNEDPGTDTETDPLFYAPELINEIVTSQVPHEVCTHTYSHILCEQVPDSLLDHELETVKQLHAQGGLAEPVSIVIPRHQHPSYEVLEKNDIKTIRTPLPEYDPPFWKNALGGAGSFLWILSRKHPVAELDQDNGITKTYCTPYPSLTASFLPAGQRVPHPAFRAIPLQIRKRIHANYLKSAIDNAAEKNKHAHLWTHLHNMANDAQYRAIRLGFEHLAKRRNQGEVAIKRMDELAEVTVDG